MKDVLVTGAGGFIGTHLIGALLVKDVRVTAVARKDSRPSSLSTPVRTAPNLAWVYSSVEDWSKKVVLPPRSTIVHLAGNPEVNRSNCEKTIDKELRLLTGVLNAAGRSESCRIIYASSSLVYGKPHNFPITEDFPVLHDDAYATAKFEAEAVLASCDFESIALRLFNVYGPQQPERTVMGKICADAATGRQSFVRGIPELERPIDFVYVRDVAEVIAELVTLSAFPEQILNVGSGCSARPTSIADEVLGNRTDPARWNIPWGVDVGSSSRSALDSVIGNRTVTPLINGITETLDWFYSGPSRGAAHPGLPDVI